jgi:transposase
LTGKEKQELRQAKCRGSGPARLVLRILIILMANDGKTISETAKSLGCCEQTVLNQRKRFLGCRTAGAVAALRDLPRSGRPPIYGATARVQVIAIVCETLRQHELPLSRFAMRDLLPIVRGEGDLPHLSPSTLQRILEENVLKPWRYRYWLYPRDPEFVPKACVVLNLYAGVWGDAPLGPDDYVISADEKTIQVLQRCHAGQAAAPGYPQRVEFEYVRHGTIAYHAAWDVLRGRIFGRVAESTCIATFNDLLDLVMQQEPYRSAARVFWIVDGGSAHHLSTFPTRLEARYPNAMALALPTHSSWLNQIELYFSIVQRKVLTPLDVRDDVHLTRRLLDFQDYYQLSARPFQWTFTSQALKARLAELKNYASPYHTPRTSGMEV